MLPTSPNLQSLIQNNMGNINFMLKLNGYSKTLGKLTKIFQNLTKDLQITSTSMENTLMTF